MLFPHAGGMLRAFDGPVAGLGHLQTEDTYGERILVVLRMFGGNDGLNTIVPIHDDEYYRIRQQSSQHDLSIARERVLMSSGLNGHGLHPSMSPLHELFEEGKVAIVQGVGYPNMDLSHFRGTDIWLSASDAHEYINSGWLGRMIDERIDRRGPYGMKAPYALEFGKTVGAALVGAHGTHGHYVSQRSKYHDDVGEIFSVGGHEGAEVLHERFVSAQRYGTALESALTNVAHHTRVFPEESPLASSLQTISRLIRSGLPTQIYVVHAGQFDTHHHQQQVHAQQLDELFSSTLAFIRELEDSGDADRVCVLVMSEFGRRVEPTESGTDHGTAAPVFLIGHGVRGGIYGEAPTVRDLDQHGNLRWNVDFRQIYASVLRQWFDEDMDSTDQVILQRRFQPLPLFHVAGHTRTELVRIRPIPVHDMIRVVGTVPAPLQATIEISDLSGHVLNRSAMDLSSEISLSARSLSAGVYLLTVSAENGHIQRVAFPVEPR